MPKNEDIITVSWQNGHYEVYDHINNSTWVHVMMPFNGSREMDSLDVCSAVETILREYEERKGNE